MSVNHIKFYLQSMKNTCIWDLKFTRLKKAINVKISYIRMRILFLMTNDMICHISISSWSRHILWPWYSCQQNFSTWRNIKGMYVSNTEPKWQHSFTDFAKYLGSVLSLTGNVFTKCLLRDLCISSLYIHSLYQQIS